MLSIVQGSGQTIIDHGGGDLRQGLLCVCARCEKVHCKPTLDLYKTPYTPLTNPALTNPTQQPPLAAHTCSAAITEARNDSAAQCRSSFNADSTPLAKMARGGCSMRAAGGAASSIPPADASAAAPGGGTGALRSRPREVVTQRWVSREVMHRSSDSAST